MEHWKNKNKKNWKFRKKPSHCSILPAHCSILPAHCSKLPAGYGVNSWYIKYINWCPREKPQYSENSIKPQRKICHLSPLALRALWLKWQIFLFSLLEFSSYFGFLPLTPVDIQYYTSDFEIFENICMWINISIYMERRGYMVRGEVYGKYTSPLQRYLENIPLFSKIKSWAENILSVKAS